MSKIDSKDIRDGLIRLVEKAPAGGIFTEAQTEPVMRNAFALRPDPEGPIYTVTVTYGGAMVSRSLDSRLNRLYADWRGDRITDAEYREQLDELGYKKGTLSGRPEPK